MSLYLIDRHNGEAVYRQIRKILAVEVHDRYKSGDCLPTEQELAERFHVNRHTVRRAVDELVAEGLVERRHGKGTFVLDPAIDYAIGERTRFTENLEAVGQTTDSRILRKLVIAAEGGVAQRLRVAPGTPVIWIETLRAVGGRPFCVISHFLPRAGHAHVLEDYLGGSLHAFLNRAGTNLRRSLSLISAATPQGDDASLLQMPRNLPVLRVKSVNVDTVSGVPVEYAVTRFRADRVQLSVNP